MLDAWKFSKNLRTEEMLFVVAKGEKRAGEEGKETLFLHGGTQITREKIEKFKRRRIAYPKQVDDVNARKQIQLIAVTDMAFSDLISFKSRNS